MAGAGQRMAAAFRLRYPALIAHYSMVIAPDK
jgi:hypothetical protein